MSSSRAQSSSNWRVRQSPSALPPAESVLARQARRPSIEWDYREKQRFVRRQQETQDAAAREPAQGTRIYVGNMPYTAQKKDVERLFKENDIEIINIDISIDPFTSRNPSYCFVDLSSTESAESTMQMLSGKDFHGRPLKVKPCVQKTIKPSRCQSNDLVSSRWHQGSQVRTGPQHAQSFQQSSILDPRAPVRENRRVYVGNLPKPLDNHASDLEIRDIFRDFEVKAVSKVISPGRGMIHGNKWYAFVDVSSAEEAERAVVQLDGMKMWGDHLVVKIASGFPEKIHETGCN